MQPPPRKGSSVKFLKTLHAEQIAKLQVKNQTECELLEDLRSFMIKKSALEKSYCEALLKITSVYLNKKITTNIPDLKTEGSDERWNMWSVWRTVLEENEKLSKARLAAIEIYLQQISDDAKILRIQKLQATKKCVDLLSSIQKEVQATVQDVEKTKKIYFDEEHCAHDVRDKAKDIEARLKRKKGSFFQSLSTLQKSSAKVSLKREQMDDKSVGARNDYLLSLASANAHQTRYFVNDLQTIMQTMESGVYDKVQEYFTLLGRAELLTCMAQQASFSKVKDQAQQLTREYNLQCLYLYYPVLKQHIQYDFEPCDNDSIDYVTFGYGSTAVQCIADEVKEWLEIVAREKRNIRTKTRRIQNLCILRENGEKVDPTDPSGPDIDTKIDELQETIRKSEVIKVKTDAKVEMLRKSSDDNVKDMVKKLEDELNASLDYEEEEFKSEEVQQPTVSELVKKDTEEAAYSSEEETVSYKAAEKNTSVDEDSGGGASSYTPYNLSRSEDVFKQLEASWDTSDQASANYIDPASATIYKPEDENLQNTSYEEFETPFRCTVLYNYTAQNPDELTIIAHEELEILGEGDGDGWLRARNSSGREGFVPCTYLDSFTGAEEEPVDHEEALVAGTTSHLAPQISFSSVDYIVDAKDDGTAATDNYEANVYLDMAVQQLDSDQVTPFVPPLVGEPPIAYPTERYDDAEYCIALYDYESNGEDELAFSEGQIIKILRKIVHDGIDDGWWEGEVDGQKGLFPSLVVQECNRDGHPLNDDEDGDEVPMSAPPLFTPPEIPEHLLSDLGTSSSTEPQPAFPFGENDQGNAEKFAFDKISDNQHKQYNTQFKEEQTPPDLPTPPTPPTPPAVKVVTPPRNSVPDISINIVCEDDNSEDGDIPSFEIQEAPDNNGDSSKQEEGGDFNLGVTQIVITAPTPSSDNADKTFPPDPAPDDLQMSIAAATLERRKSAGEINEAEPPLYDATLNDCVDYPTTIIEEPEEEEAEDISRFKEDCGDHQAAPTPSYPQTVPEQLEPHQLQRLQQLKESNA